MTAQPDQRAKSWWPLSRKGKLAVLAAVGVVGLLALWIALSGRPVVVTVETLVEAPASRVLAVNGQIAAEQSVQLRAAVSATALDLLVDEGDRVAVGDVLARLDSEQQEAVVRQAEYALGQGRIKQAQTAAAFDRSRGLGEVVARSRLEDEQRDMEAASKEVERLRALLDQARIQLNRYTITAPIAGTVMSRSVDLGQLVDTTTPLFTLADLGHLVVETNVDEAYATQIAVGQVARLQLVGSPETLTGKVSFVSPKVDVTTGGRAIKIAFDAPLEAPVGLTVTANIVVESRDAALTLPRAALLDGSVFVLAGGKAVKTPVEVIDWPAERLIVTKGLAAGDAVILDPTGLTDGQRVRQAK